MIDAKMVRDIATKYIYDRCPAVVGVGKNSFFDLNSFTLRKRNHFVNVEQLAAPLLKCYQKTFILMVVLDSFNHRLTEIWTFP